LILTKSDEQKKPESYTSLIKCLTECEKGEDVIVKSILVGYRQKQRLANLGLFPGAIIKKKKNAPFRGPLEIIVKGSSLVIGRGIASKIMVQCNKSCKSV
jgi:Fe2+ transport system protein FeoA